jgi:hypothetical protein
MLTHGMKGADMKAGLMMGMVLLVIGICHFSAAVHAEEEETPEFVTEHRNWKLAGIVSGSLNVIQFTDWQAGGNDTVSITGRGEFWAVRSTERYEWKNRLRSEYGVSKTNGDGFRKSADLLKLDSRFERKFQSKAMAYGRGYLDTHLANQYDYFDALSDVILDGQRIYTDIEKFRVSRGLDPLMLEQGLGIGYTLYKTEDQSSEITIMSGLGARQTVTDAYYIADDDESTPEFEYSTVDSDSEFGVELVLDTLITINKHAKFTSFAVLFMGLDDNLWRIRWDNALDITLGQYVGVSLTADFIYDESIFDRAQYRTGTLLTLSYRMF